MKKIVLIIVAICIPFVVFGQLLTTYEYDELNRLVQVDYPNGQRVEYEYDALGNRISRTVSQLLVIRVSIDPEGAGTVSGAGNYEPQSDVTLTATANEGYQFVNWTEDGVVVSTEETYSFTAVASRQLVANFEESYATQIVELSQGTNWFSTYLDITLNDLKAALLTALSSGNSTSIVIKSQTQNTTYRNGRWIGSLTTLDFKQMYMIKVGAACEIVLEGMPINAAELTVTINNGANWIAFPYNTSMSVSGFFSGLPPVNNDVVKSQTQNATYKSGRWSGQLRNLEPGHGYIYKSAATENRVFTFPASAK